MPSHLNPCPLANVLRNYASFTIDDFQNLLFKFGHRFWNDNYKLTQLGSIWRNEDF